MKLYIQKSFLFLITITTIIPNFRALDQMLSEFIYFGVILFLSMLYLVFWEENIDDYLKKLLHFPLTYIVLVFLIFSLLSICNSVNLYESYISISKYLLIIIGVLILSILFKKINFSFLQILIILLLFIESSKIIYEFIKHFDSEAPILRSPLYAGFAANVNVAAFSILFKIPFFLFAIKESTSFKKQVLLSILLSIPIFCIFLCYSRGAIFGLFLILIGLIVSVFIYKKNIQLIKNTTKKIIILTISSLLALFIFAVVYSNSKDQASIIKRATEIDTQNPQSSFNTRLGYYKDSIEAMLDNPIFGIGIGNWKITSIKYGKDDILGYQIPYHTHNDFLQIGAETGIVGGISFLSIFIYILYNLIRLFKNSNYDKKVLIPLILCLFIYVLDSSLNFPRARPSSFINLSLIIGFLLSNNFFRINETN